MYEGKHIHFSLVDNKPLCSYSPKLCKQRRLNGYAFCIRHVLEDKSAPFKQCQYVSKYNNQRCTNPIPKAEDRVYCNSHLQVLGLAPKKERKRKVEVIEEGREHGVVAPSDSPPPRNGLHLFATWPDVSASIKTDPFAFPEEEDQQSLRKAALKRKLQSRVVGMGTSPHPPPGNEDSESEAIISTMTVTADIQKTHLSPPSSLSLQPQPRHQDTGLALPVAGAGCCYHASAPFPPPQEPFLDHSPPTPSGVVSRKAVACLEMSEATQQHGKGDNRVFWRRSPQTKCKLRGRAGDLERLLQQQRIFNEDLLPHLDCEWSEDDYSDDDTLWRLPCQQVCTFSSTSWVDEERAPVGASREACIAALVSRLRHRCLQLWRQERDAASWVRRRAGIGLALVATAATCPARAARLLRSEIVLKSSTREQRPCFGSDGASCAHLRSPSVQRCPGAPGESCGMPTLPYSPHCLHHILCSPAQRLFSSCTACFADGQQCSVPVFDITRPTPLCDEHAKKMDNFLRGDSGRKMHHHHYHHHHHHHHNRLHPTASRKPRKKSKMPAFSKKHKKKKRRVVSATRPQKPVPPAEPLGNLSLPSILPHVPADRSSPQAGDLRVEDLPSDLTDDLSNDLELNQEDLEELHVDLHDFDLFEGKNGELLPTKEEAEALERVLAEASCEVTSLERFGDDLSTLNSDLHDLLNGDIASDSFSGLDLEPGILQEAGAGGLLSATFQTVPPVSMPTLLPAVTLEQSVRQSAQQYVPPSLQSVLLSAGRLPNKSVAFLPTGYGIETVTTLDTNSTGNYQQPILEESVTTIRTTDVASSHRPLWPPLGLAEASDYGTPPRQLHGQDESLLQSISQPSASFQGSAGIAKTFGALQVSASVASLPSAAIPDDQELAAGNVTLAIASPAQQPKGIADGNGTSWGPQGASEASRSKLPQFSTVFGVQLTATRGGIPKDAQPLRSVVLPASPPDDSASGIQPVSLHSGEL
uniref:INO80 complex subunit D n=1 Tax=Myxine glutinosa TaxID=7769 RepID=UPI00358EA11E